MGHLLEVQRLTKRFGGLTAVSDVSFSVEKGEIFGVIGPNGAGKTTLFNVIAGHYRPSGGTVAFDGHNITGHSADEISRRGIARTFQAVHLFKEETVGENLRRAQMIARCHNPALHQIQRLLAAVGDQHIVVWPSIPGSPCLFQQILTQRSVPAG